MTALTVEELDKLVLKKLAETFIAPLNQTLVQFEINTNPRICHFLAQILHESGNLNYTEEIASGVAYEGRADLGNTQTGDGARFKGRGLIQITGRNNYSLVSKYFGIDFISKPELLESPKWASLSAGWFWATKNLNKWADLPDTWRGDFTKKRRKLSPIEIISRIINGGTNGLEDRIHNYSILKSIRP